MPPRDTKLILELLKLHDFRLNGEAGIFRGNSRNTTGRIPAQLAVTQLFEPWAIAIRARLMLRGERHPQEFLAAHARNPKIETLDGGEFATTIEQMAEAGNPAFAEAARAVHAAGDAVPGFADGESITGTPAEIAARVMRGIHREATSRLIAPKKKQKAETKAQAAARHQREMEEMKSRVDAAEGKGQEDVPPPAYMAPPRVPSPPRKKNQSPLEEVSEMLGRMGDLTAAQRAQMLEAEMVRYGDEHGTAAVEGRNAEVLEHLSGALELARRQIAGEAMRDVAVRDEQARRIEGARGRIATREMFAARDARLAREMAERDQIDQRVGPDPEMPGEGKEDMNPGDNLAVQQGLIDIEAVYAMEGLGDGPAPILQVEPEPQVPINGDDVVPDVDEVDPSLADEIDFALVPRDRTRHRPQARANYLEMFTPMADVVAQGPQNTIQPLNRRLDVLPPGAPAGSRLPRATEAKLADPQRDQGERDPPPVRGEGRIPSSRIGLRVSTVEKAFKLRHRGDSNDPSTILGRLIHSYMVMHPDASREQAQEIIVETYERNVAAAREAVGETNVFPPAIEDAINALVLDQMIIQVQSGDDPGSWLNAGAIAGAILASNAIPAALAGAATGGASAWPLLVSSGIALLPFLRDAYEEYKNHGHEGESAEEREGKEREQKYPHEEKYPGGQNEPGNGGGEPAPHAAAPGPSIASRIRSAFGLPVGAAISATILHMASTRIPGLKDYIKSKLPNWDGVSKLDENQTAVVNEGLVTNATNAATGVAGEVAKGAAVDLAAGSAANVARAVGQRTIQFREKPIELSAADRAYASQTTYGDIKPTQDVDNERGTGDLRPSFWQASPDLNKQSSLEAVKERVKFANFNYVAPGFGAARRNPIAAANREWDARVCFTEPIYTEGLDPVAPLDLVSAIRPAIGTSASNAVVDPMQIWMLRKAMLKRQSAKHLMANVLVRDVMNNTATLKPVAAINTIDTDLPVTDLVPVDTEYAAYWDTNPVVNPQDGMALPMVWQHGKDIGPYRSVPAGRSFPLAPYQTGTNPTNYFVRGGQAQQFWNRAPGAAQSLYAPSEQGLLNGLDLSACSEYLDPLPPNFGRRATRSSMLQGAEIPFPTRVVNADIFNQAR